MSINHHPPEEFLFDYATGALGESWSLAIATHLAMCPTCRKTVATYEAVGGESLAELEPAPMSASARAACLEALSAPTPEAAPPRPKPARAPVFPEPLRSFIEADLDDLKWSSIGAGIRQKLLPTRDAGMARLLHIPPGVATPWHSHRGMEFTLVLSGGFYDGDEAFTRGDIEVTDRTTPHQPKAMDDAPCVTLAVTDSPLRFVSLLPRLFQPFLRI